MFKACTGNCILPESCVV